MWDFNVGFTIISSAPNGRGRRLAGVDVGDRLTTELKVLALRDAPLEWVEYEQLLKDPDHRFSFSAASDLPLLAEYAVSSQGLCTGDFPRFGRSFWEYPLPSDDWEYLQSTVSLPVHYGGRQGIVMWEKGKGALVRFIEERLGAGKTSAWIRGLEHLGARGIVVSQTGSLATTLFTGTMIDNNVAIVVPREPENVPPVWAYLSSPDYATAVREIDPKLNVTGGTLVKVPFDIKHWRKVAEDAGSLPEPWSDDPTQWLFDGRPESSTMPLQVAVARLVGYRWPEQADPDDLDTFADKDGIVCLPSVAGEAPAADRAQQLLAAAFGEAWSPARVTELLEQTGSKKRNLADWLRDEFFKQHCALYGNRPFVWHIWDGQRDGFSALVNYHRLDRKLLEKLTYGYLGQDWVERLRDDVRDEVAGAEARLSAALNLQRRLEAIIDGEKPYDIYVRWKELHEQPLGWEPDLNDGVRLNIRPFVEADVLRAPFNIHWRKDRGRNPDGSERHNDIHLTRAEKTAARDRAGRV